MKRGVASLAKRLVLRWGYLPVDVQAGALRLRCRFTDNFCERKFVFTPWRYDVGERRLLRAHLPEDGVFVDIGANIGLYTLFAAEALGPRGRILAFEPNPPALSRLETNLAANRGAPHRPEIAVLPIGVADTDCERSLHQHVSNLGSCSLVRHGSSTAAASIVCRPLLAVLREREIPRIDVLKIDIEGAEDSALVPFLEHAEDDLLPQLMLIEHESSALWRRDLFAAMATRGYTSLARTQRNVAMALTPGPARPRP